MNSFRLSFLNLLLGCICINLLGQTPNNNPNILFISIDDMNDWAGYMHTHPQVKTPHMDDMAKKGIAFTNAHCPAPICGPSRTAILSGTWPTSNGIYTNAINYKKQLPHLISLPEHFRQNGYYTMGVGKVFHSGIARIPDGAFHEYGGREGSAFPFKDELEIVNQTPFHKVVINEKEFFLPLNGIPADRHWNKNHTFDWGAVDLPDSMFSDIKSVEWAIEKLQQKHQKPFFLAMGFERPHQPLFNPQRFHDQYPLESVVIPQHFKNDLEDVPRAGQEYALVAGTSGLHKSVVQYGQWENAVSSYLASISYVDDLVGKLMNALAKSSYAENILVILWSDHGWHLGEKEHWGKATGWLRSTRVPLIIIPPKNDTRFKHQGSSNRPVNLIDIAPTLADFTGIPHREAWEGKSLIPLINNPQADWKEYTTTTFGLGNHTITTERWQYIHYFDGSIELYDLQRDPNEFFNLAQEKKYQKVIGHLHQYLPQEPKWKHFVRYHNFKAAIPADGSPTKLFNLAYRNQFNEQLSVADDYPEVVAKIEKWVKETQPSSKFLKLE